MFFPSKYSLSLVAKLGISHLMLFFYFLSNVWMAGNDTEGNLAPRLALQECLSAMQIPAAFSTCYPQMSVILKRGGERRKKKKLYQLDDTFLSIDLYCFKNLNHLIRL